MYRKIKIKISDIFSSFKMQWLKVANCVRKVNFLIFSSLHLCCSTLCFHTLTLTKMDNAGAKSINTCTITAASRGSVCTAVMKLFCFQVFHEKKKKGHAFTYFPVSQSKTSQTFPKHLVSFSLPSTTSFISFLVASGPCLHVLLIPLL